MSFRNVSDCELARIEHGKSADHMGQQCLKVPYRAMLYDKVENFSLTFLIYK